MFTAATVKCDLQIAQSCAVNKINSYITNQKNGKRCENDFSDAELMFNLIDSLRGFIPEGSLIGGVQANSNQESGGGLLWAIQESGGTAIVDLTVGDFTYPTMTIPNASTEEILAIEIASIVNSYYPEFPYTAYFAVQTVFVTYNTVVIVGSDYELSNGTVAFGTVTANTGSNGTNFSLNGGIPQEPKGPNCLTNQEAQIILNKLKSLCGC